MTRNDLSSYQDITKYIWCKRFKLSDFPECCKNCKDHTCDSDDSVKEKT